MRFYDGPHRHWCGIDLHARRCTSASSTPRARCWSTGTFVAPRRSFLAVVAPYREQLVVAVECIFTWYWLADLCAREGIAFVRGHALFMKAIHGGKAKNDRIDARKIATLLRGGMLPQAYAYPAGMRATRDLLRRRLHLVRKRGQLFAHIQMTSHQYNLDPLGKRIAYPAIRTAVASHFPDPAVRKSIAVDLAFLERYDCSSYFWPRWNTSSSTRRWRIARSPSPLPSRCRTDRARPSRSGLVVWRSDRGRPEVFADHRPSPFP
jgi:hypothetical protein